MPKSDISEQFQEQLKRILDEYALLRTKSKYADLSDMGLSNVHRLISLTRAAIERVSGSNSAYARQFEVALNRQPSHDYERLSMIIGIAESLLADLEAGYIYSVSDLLHSDIFADLLEMADHLLEEGYKDAAAVMCGGALESHLRQLCNKNNVDIEIRTASGARPKRADAMNSDLGKEGIYSKLYQKNVTSWLDLRNNAAHAKYENYSRDQVALMIAGVRDFISSHPA